MNKFQSSYRLLIVFLFGLLVSSCANRGFKKQANKKNLPELMTNMRSSEFNADWMSLKAEIDVYRDGKKTGFRSNVRMRKDSAIWISITPLLGVELARLLLTPDSVMLMNRIEDNYFLGNYDFLSNKMNTEISYELIQSLLLGNSLSIDENEKLKGSIDGELYLLSGLRSKRLAKRIEKESEPKKDKKDKGKEKSDEEKKERFTKIISIWLNPDNYKIPKQSIQDFIDNRSLSIEFKDFEKVKDQLFPYETYIYIKAEQNIDIEVEYSFVTINEPKSMPFKISSKYVRIY